MGLQARTVANAMIRHWLTIFDVPAVICSDRGSQFVGTWFKTMCKHMGIRHAKPVAYHSRSNGRAEVAGRQMFEKFRQQHIDEPGRNWYNSLWRVLQAYHDLQGPTGLSPHRIPFLRDRVSRTLPWLNHGKVARDANAMMAEADDTAAKVCKALQDEHDKRAKYFKQGKVQKYALQDTVWVERHHKDVLSRHRQASWYVPGVIVRKVGQDVYAVRVGDNKILDRNHTQLCPRAPDPSGRPVTFEFTAGNVDSDDEGEDDDFTAEIMGFCNYFSGHVRMYAELSGPLHKMLQVGKFDGWKGSKKKLAWTPEAEVAFSRLKERLLGQLGLFLVDPDKGFVLRTDASNYAVGAVLEQIRDDGSHVPVAFWSRILAEGQRRTWTARDKKTYAIVCALRKWSGHIGLQPVVVCTDHQSLQSWHKEHVDTPSGPAARRARWHETFAKFDLSVVYVPGKDNTVADCLSRWAYPAGKAWMDISSHGDAGESEEAKRIIEMEKAMEQEGVKCFVLMANRTDLAKFRGARVQAI